MGLDYTDETWVRKLQNDYDDLKQRAASLEGALETSAKVLATVEAERDELRDILTEIRAETFMPDGTRLYDAVKQIMQECDMMRQTLKKVKRILAVGRNVGEDKEQAYQDAEEIIDFALSRMKVTP